MYSPPMYSWSNKPRFNTLRVQGSGDILFFECPGEKATVHLAKDGSVEKVVFNDVVIHPERWHHSVVGEGNWQRDVYQFLLPGGPAPTMRVGITKQRRILSSTPHDFEMNTELGFEEVFFHMLEGGSKKAIQIGCGKWFDGTIANDVWTVHDRTFSTIPMGVHPVIAEPDVRVSYVWAYLAKYPRWEKVK